MEFPLEVRYLHSENGPVSSASLRKKNEDFQVDEILGFDLSGEGEHLYLQIRKNGQNTAWVKEQLASQLGIHPRDIGHSGLKDRHAITSQWLSIYAPKNEPELETVQIDGVQILQSSRHRQKLKPGMHEANCFQLLLTEFLGGSCNSYKESTEHILTQIKNTGFPNYFGEQRFGREGGNLPKAWQLINQRRLNKHKKKSIYLSSLRSFLFNRVLDAQIATDVNTDLSGPLWGRGRLNIDQAQAEIEHRALQPWSELCEALEFSGLQQERRPLFVIPENFNWSWQQSDQESGQKSNQLQLAFNLPSGSYATSMLREIANITDLALIRTSK